MLLTRGKETEAAIQGLSDGRRTGNLQVQAMEAIRSSLLNSAHEFESCHCPGVASWVDARPPSREMRYISMYRGRGSSISRKGFSPLTSQQWPTKSLSTRPIPKHRATSIPARRRSNSESARESDIQVAPKASRAEWRSPQKPLSSRRCLHGEPTDSSWTRARGRPAAASALASRGQQPQRRKLAETDRMGDRSQFHDCFRRPSDVNESEPLF